jgi:hypothetical protein
MKAEVASIAPTIVALLIFGGTCAADTVVVGPGPHPLLYVTDDDDYHVLDGTQITSPSLSGPPSTFVVVTDAIEFRGGGHIRIDGGQFQGGDATYTGSHSAASTVAGDALHLRQSSGIVYGGTFLGGDASATRGLIQAGSGLILVESKLSLHGGRFEGGTTTYLNPLGLVYEEPAIIAYDRSALWMHGGVVDGDIVLYRSSRLGIFGTELAYDGEFLSGNYADGTSFLHRVRNNGGRILFNPTVPEPSTLLILPASVAAACSFRCRRQVG